MNAKASSLEAVIESVADGGPIHWRSLESLTDEASRRRLRYLHLVARIAEVHRTQTDDEPADLSATVVPRSARWADALGTSHASREDRRRRLRRGLPRADAWLDREVALKLLKPGYSSGEGHGPRPPGKRERSRASVTRTS